MPRKWKKNDSLKARLDLLPPSALELVGHLLRHGAGKYSVDGWKDCKDPTRYVAAQLRHTLKHMRGEFLDQDSGLPHLASAAVNSLFALDLYLNGVQDRFTVGNYFGIVERGRKRSKSGVIKKRFRTFPRAWKYMEDNELDMDKYVVKSLPYSNKVGQKTRLSA